jgi:inhibitor of KinA
VEITPAYQIYACGDEAITIEFGKGIDADINARVLGLYQYLQQHPIAGTKDLIPAYNSLTLVYDAVALLQKTLPDKLFRYITDQITNVIHHAAVTSVSLQRQVSIPVCYDLSLAPDLPELAALHHLSVEEVIQLHTSRKYRVYMIGFLPGFAYMGTVHEKITTPRKSSPRTSVPKGSVGIAGAQTGIYPFDSPGGWQLIGRTPSVLFDPSKEQPCLLQPGDELQFVPVSLTDYQNLLKP